MPKVINLLSYHIAEDIEKFISINKLEPDSKIPSERELAEHYNVTRVTLRNGLQKLIDNGVIYNIPSSGYFVSYPKVVRNASYFFFPKSDPLLKLYHYTQEELDIVNSPTRLISIPFSTDDLKEIHVRGYIEKVNDTPVSITYTFQNKKGYSKYPNLFNEKKADCFKQIQKFRVYHANDNEMQLLKVTANETLTLISEFIKENDELIAVCESIVVGTRCEIKLDIKTSNA